MINSVDKALKILSVLADNENKPVKIIDLAKIININRSTCSHIIKTLADNGYVERVSHSEGYILGPEAYYLSHLGKYGEEIISICRPVMNWLHKKTGYVVILSAIKNNQKFILDYIDKEHIFFDKNESIRKDDVLRTATGRIILANMNENEILSYYEKNKDINDTLWNGITSFDELINELNKINKKGIVCTQYFDYDINKNCIGYGCAIFKKSKCIGALGVAISRNDNSFDEAKEEDVKKYLLSAVKEINRRFSNYI